MAKKYVEPWDGGYIHRQKDGRKLFVIQREIGGKRFHVSTRAHSSTAAHEQLKKFESDPEAYVEQMRNRRPDEGGLQLTAELVLELKSHMLTRPRPTSRPYAVRTARILREWITDLNGRDLRKMTLADYKDCLRQHDTDVPGRIVAIKTLCTYLRQERSVLDRKDDATLDLPVPQAVPEKHKRRKAVPIEDVRAVLGVLVPPYRDALLLLAHVGWHTSELRRFMSEPESRIASGRGDVLGVLQVRHKSGATTRTPVRDRAVLQAAERLRARATTLPLLNDALDSACLVAKVPKFTAGVMRHSVATWAIESGTPPEQVAEFLGHRSKSTTLRFYADVAVPTVGIQLPKLT